MKLIVQVFLFCLLSLGFSYLSAQERATEEEMKQEAIFLLASQKSILGKYDEAIELLNQLIDKDGLNGALYYELARAYQGKGDLDAAVTAIDKALKLDKSNVWFWLLKANIAEELTDFLGAAVAYDKAVDIKPDANLFWRNYLALEKANKLAAGIAVLDQAEKTFGINDDWTNAKVEAYVKLGDKTAAVNELIKPTQVQPRKVDYWTRLGNFHLLMGQKDQALKVFEKVLELKPNDENAAFQVTVLAKKTKSDDLLGVLVMDDRISLDEKVKALIPELEKAADKNDVEVLNKLFLYSDKLVSQYPEIAQVYALRGDINSLLKDYPAATEDYKQALTYNKSIFDVWYQLLNGLNRVEDWKSLEDYSLQALDYYPNQPAPYLYYAISLAKNEQLNEAEQYLEEAKLLTIKNSPYQIDLIWAGAILDQQKGNLDAALSAIQPLADSKQINDAALSEYYGDLLFQNGDKALAKEYWEKALKMGAPSARIKTKLQNS